MKYDRLLVDASHMLNRCVHSTDASDVLDNEDIVRYQYLTALEELSEDEKNELQRLDDNYIDVKSKLTLHAFITTLFSTIRANDCSKVVVAWDGGSWRYNVYPEYKSGRKKKRGDRTETEKRLWKELHSSANSLHTLLSEHTNIISIREKNCEADDIIATLCSEGGKSLIVSSDKDFYQLLQNPNVDIYDPIAVKKVDLSVDEARYSLFMKLIRGDSSDSIPSSWPRMKEEPYKNFDRAKPSIKDLFGDELLLVEHLNADKDEALLTELNSLMEKDSPTQKDEQRIKNIETRMQFGKKFRLNEQLISFKYIPDEIKEKILTPYNKQLTKNNEFDMFVWIEFCREYKLKVLLKNLEECKDILF